MSQEQTPIQKKISELKEKHHYIAYDVDDMLMEFAQYIKEEVVPEEAKGGDKTSAVYNFHRSKVVDKFREMGI